MACCLFGTKPLPEPVLTHCQPGHQEYISTKSHSQSKIFSSRKRVCKYCAIMFRPQSADFFLLNISVGYRCNWEAGPCSPEMWNMSATDYGMCYTFNHGQGTDTLRSVAPGKSPQQMITSWHGTIFWPFVRGIHWRPVDSPCKRASNVGVSCFLWGTPGKMIAQTMELLVIRYAMMFMWNL